MRRILLILTVAALMVAMMAASPGSVSAQASVQHLDACAGGPEQISNGKGTLVDTPSGNETFHCHGEGVATRPAQHSSLDGCKGVTTPSGQNHFTCH
jgi:hypothetical protein